MGRGVGGHDQQASWLLRNLKNPLNQKTWVGKIYGGLDKAEKGLISREIPQRHGRAFKELDGKRVQVIYLVRFRLCQSQMFPSIGICNYRLTQT